MKIYFSLGSMRKGGAERVISNLANELSKRYDIGIIITVNEESQYKLDKKINLFSLDEKEVKNNNFIIKNIKRIKKLDKILKKEKPDIIVSLLPEPTYRVLFLNLFGRKNKIIVSVRNDPKKEYNNIIKRIIMKVLYERADGFIFQTAEAKKFFSKKIQSKSTIIPNPINEEFITTPYEGERDKTIVTVGRLEKQKNHKLLIEAFNSIQKDYPDYKLLIYGSGRKEEELKQYVKEIDLVDKVKFKGNVNNVKEEIYKSGMFILSSDYEGMPNALMEAMALGLPVISTDCPCGGPKFLIENAKNGILVPVRKKEDMIEAIKYILENENESKKMGRQANTITDKVNPTRIYSMWEDYILKILNKRDK